MILKKLIIDGLDYAPVDTNDEMFLNSFGLDKETLEADETARLKAISDREHAKMNADYKGKNASLTSKDALGLLQVESAFSLGVKSTKFVFANGTLMDIKAKDFVAFATWFAVERNKLFV